MHNILFDWGEVNILPHFAKSENSEYIKQILAEIIEFIQNITQEKKSEQNIQKKENPLQGKIINSFQELINICSDKKEIKLKYIIMYSDLL